MNYLREPVFLSAVPAVNEPNAQNANIVPIPQQPLISQASLATPHFIRPRLIQVQQQSPTTQIDISSQHNPTQPTHFLLSNGCDDQFGVCLPQPINYTNLNQTEKAIHVIAHQNKPQISNRIYPVNEQSKAVSNNINFRVETNKQPRPLAQKRNICIGLIIGCLLAIILVVVAVVTIFILRKNIPLLNDLSLATKAPRIRSNCPFGYSGIGCSTQCSSNITASVISISFRYKVDQKIEDAFLTITERRNLYGILLDETSLLIAKQNLLTKFNYMYNGIENSINIVPNKYFPKYETMYSASLSPNDVTKFKYYFVSNIGEIIQHTSSNLAILKLTDGFKFVNSDSDINCLFHFKPEIPFSMTQVNSDEFYGNENWIKQIY